MDRNIEDLVDAMTLEEQVSLLSGADAWTTAPIARLGIGRLKVTDGPTGARGENFIDGTKSAAFPVGIALGASFDSELMRELGGALAREAKAKGAQVLLGPTVNLHRSVTNGRNFECFSEDPLLTATLASAYIEGLQAGGVGATIKHFVGNESEIERTTMDSVVDERALRELYFLPFEWAVKRAGTWAIMSSYNQLNGTFTAESRWLLTDVLRGDWNYTGIVVSDWWGSHTTAPTVNAGLDIEMPGPPRDRGQKLVDAVAHGQVSAATVRERALNMLRLLQRTGAIDRMELTPERTDDRPETRALIRRAGAAGMVLLKNEGSILPLAGDGAIAVIGPNAKTARAMGGGSSQLNAYYEVSPWQGLVAALGEDRLRFAEGVTNHRFEPAFGTSLEGEFYDSDDFSGPVAAKLTVPPGGFFLTFNGQIEGVADPRRWSAIFRGAFEPTASGIHRIGIVSIGFAKVYVDDELIVDSWTNWTRGRPLFEEGGEEVIAELPLEAGRSYAIRIELLRRPTHVLDIPGFRLGIGRPLGDADIAAAVDAARGAKTALVFVGRNGEWDTEGSDLTHIELPGRQNELVAAVAAANPRTVVVLQTGGPVEMPWLNDVAAVIEAWYPGQEAGNAIADVLTGAVEPSGRLPQTFPRRWSDNPTHSQDLEVYPGLNGKVRYEEGVFIGYRHYDRIGTPPMFPFGFGLGYTRFDLTGLQIDTAQFESTGAVTVTVTATNTSDRNGATVIQLYVSDDTASLPRPKKELKAFAKIALDAGRSQTVTLKLDARAFAFYDVAGGSWLVEPGHFTIAVGQSSADLPLTAKLDRTAPLRLPR